MRLASFLFTVIASVNVLATRGSQLPRTSPKPLKLGILAFPRFVGLDAFGPMEMFNIARFNTPNMTMAVIAETLDPLPSTTASEFGPLSYLRPTHTIYDDLELDVLLIPGGPGSRIAYNNTEIISYVQRVYPTLQYIIGACTGVQILAKAGLLDGKKATAGSFSFQEMVRSGPTVNWVPCARWVVDGNIWTGPAGPDLAYTFIRDVFQNETLADFAANILEIEIHKDPLWDPWCQIWNTTIPALP